MRRKITIALLALGTIGGYAAGFSSLRCRQHARRDAFERHVAALCVNAARNAGAAPAAQRAAVRAQPDAVAPDNGRAP